MPSIFDMLARRLLSKRRRPREIPRRREPRQAQMRYLRFMKRLVVERDRLVQELLQPRLEQLVNRAYQESGGGRFDSWLDDVLAVFDDMRVAFGRAVPDQNIQLELFEIANETSEKSAKEHSRQMAAGMGVPVRDFSVLAVAASPGVSSRVREFIRENTRLVTTLVGQDFDRMQTIVTQGVSNGLRSEDIWKELERILPLTKSRARLIAVDQTLKLAGQLTRMRQEDAGIDEYTWDTSQDERVRPRHRELHGTRQRWDTPPIVDLKTGRRAHPGGDYRCRCQALPVLPAELLSR